MPRQQRDVFAALAQGRQRDRDDVEPVVQVLAEPAVFHELLEVGVARGDDACVELDGARFADALELALLQRAQQFRLQRERHQGDFVDEQRAAVGEFEAADARVHGAREGALRVPEEFGLGERLGNRGGVEGHEPLIAPGAVVVDRARDQFLACPRFALDQDRAVHRGHEFERGEDLLHGHALTDNAIEAVPVAKLRAQFRVLLFEAPLLEPGRQDARQLGELERLDEEVDGAALHGRDGLGHPTESRHHHREDVRIPREGRVEDLHPVGVGQAQVDDQGVVGKRLESFKGFGAVGRLRDGKPVGRERLRDHRPEVEFIVDYQDGGLSAQGHRTSPRREAVSATRH